MKVLYVSIFNIPHLGGLSTRLVAEANYLAAKGWEVHLLSPPPEKPELAGLLDPRVIRHDYSPLGAPAAVAKLWKMAGYAKAIRKLDGKHHFGVIHCHDIYSAGYSAIAGCAKKTVLTMHSVYSKDLAVMGERKLSFMRKHLFAPAKNAIDLATEHMVYRKIGRIVCVSEYEADDVTAKTGKRPIILRNWVDTKRFAPANAASARRKIGFPKDRTIGIFIGRMVPKNGPLTIAKAVSMAAKKDAKLMFYFAGEGSERSECERQAKALGMEKRVLFLGSRTDAPALLAASDFFVSHVSSKVRGVGITVLEAASAGKAIACGKDDISSRIFKDKRDALLVKKDDADALCTAVLELSRSKKKRETLGKAARALALSQFSAESSLSKVEKILMGACG